MAHGAGVSAAQIVSDLGPDVIITGNVGPRAFQGLETAGIAIYGGADGTISEAIELLKNDKLNKLTGPTADRHENI
jgi:predicted Fe-Mo cluster-binding NifX family protein